MTFVGRVSGGTNAGRKRSLLPPFAEWECNCYVQPETISFISPELPEVTVTNPELLVRKRRPGYMRNCPDCKMRRP